jgi:heterodisulfide reductase subunit B
MIKLSLPNTELENTVKLQVAEIEKTYETIVKQENRIQYLINQINVESIMSQFKSPSDAILWAVEIGLTEEEAKQIMDNALPDDKGKKATDFIRKCLAVI